MKKILTVSGSMRPGSTNVRFLEALPSLFSSYHFTRFMELDELPVFNVERQQDLIPDGVARWKRMVYTHDYIIFSTPEYLHNIPACIKNALEWLTSSGEINDKRVLPITLTPHAPRGEKAMQSLIWSLEALNCQIVTSLSLYQNELSYQDGILVKNDSVELLEESIKILLGE